MSNLRFSWSIPLILAGLVWAYGPAARAATTPAVATSTVYQNLGFIRGNIWYSKDPFEEGDVIRIYSAVFNSSPDDLLGTVRFYDNGTAIGDNDFTVTGGGRIQDVWVDWQVTAGDHKISAEIVNAKIAVIGKAPQKISVESGKTGENQRYIAPKPKPVPPPPPEKPTGPKSTSTATSGGGGGGLLPSAQEIMPNSVSNVVGQVAGAMDQMADQAANALEKEQQAVLTRIAAVNAETDAPIDMGALDTSTKSTLGDKNTGRGTIVVKGESPSPKITLAYAWNRTYSALLGATIYVLRTHWLLYLILFIIVVLIIRWIFKKMRG